MSELTVACVQVEYYLQRGQEYVRRLYNMCQRSLPPHRFVCVSDIDDYVDGVEVIPYDWTERGWWSKIYLFKPGVLTGRVLYLDLDVVIVDRLDGLINHLCVSPGLWAANDPIYPIPESGPVTGTINSSVMLWEGDGFHDIWNLYSPWAARGLAGDQNWITKVLGREHIRLLPEGWVGSPKHRKRGKIYIFHGKPKPHEVMEYSIVRDHWR